MNMVRRGQISGSQVIIASYVCPSYASPVPDTPVVVGLNLRSLFSPLKLLLYASWCPEREIGQLCSNSDTSEEGCRGGGREPCQTVRGRREQAGDWARSHNLITFCIVIPEWRDWETISAWNVHCMKEIVWVRRPFYRRQKGLCAVSCCLPNTKHVPAEPTFLLCLLETLKRAIQEFVLDLFINARINNVARSGSRKSGPSGSSSARK